jgi:hypothetical protein
MTVEERLARLERENRRLKRVGGVVIVLCLVCVSAGAYLAQSDPVKVEDAAGTTRVQLTMTDSDESAMELFDRAGVRRIFIGENTDKRPNMTFYDGRGLRRIFLGFTTNGQPNLTFYDADGSVIP